MRLRFPEDEIRFPWLSLLLEAYSIIDKGIESSVKKRRNSVIACRIGCSNCCVALKDIPVYPLELNGIYWYANEKLENPRREMLKGRLAEKASGCPFPIEDVCSIHPVRPVSCRQFNVFGKKCEKGEDPYFTRRKDVLVPDEKITDRAFAVMLPFYGFSGSDMEEPFKSLAVKEVIHTRAVNLFDEDWGKLLKLMEDFDSIRR